MHAIHHISPTANGVREGHPPHSLESRAVVRRFGRGEPIYSAGDAADQWYRIVSGMAVSYRQFADGRRRIVDFLMPDDFFGFSAHYEHSFDAEAIVANTAVACYARRSVEIAAEAEPKVARELRAATMQALSRIQARILVFGRVTSREKLEAFLIEMSQRSSRAESGAILLQMPRSDIADYLGVSAETVSRAMTELRRRGMISMATKREVYIVKRGRVE